MTFDLSNGTQLRWINHGLILEEYWSGRILGTIGWDPSVCKSNRLHVDILRFAFIRLGYIISILLKWSEIFMQSWTSIGYFSNLTSSSITNFRFSPIIILEGHVLSLEVQKSIPLDLLEVVLCVSLQHENDVAFIFAPWPLHIYVQLGRHLYPCKPPWEVELIALIVVLNI
jgi:hypothetical protein